MLRLARKSDFDSVFKIYMDPTVNPFMNWELMSAEEFGPIFDRILATGALYAYESEEKLIAVIRLEKKTHRLSHVAYVGGFGILSQFQSKGLGLQIMKEAIRKLQAEGIQRIELIVEGDNPRAIRLYEKLGFAREGTLRRYFKRKSDDHFVDDHYMALLLN